jgi:hypothetical protein
MDKKEEIMTMNRFWYTYTLANATVALYDLF